MKKTGTRVLCLLLALLLPLSALAETRTWLEPWLIQSDADHGPNFKGSLSVSIDADELAALYDLYEAKSWETFLQYFTDLYAMFAVEDGEDMLWTLDEMLDLYASSEQVNQKQTTISLKALAALLNEMTLTCAGSETDAQYDLLLSGESVVTMGLWQHPDAGRVMTSNLFPNVAVPMDEEAENDDDDPAQRLLDAMLAHADELQTGFGSFALYYNILEAGLEGTYRDLDLYLPPSDGKYDAPLVYDRDIKHFASVFEVIGLPYAPVYTLLDKLFGYAIHQELSDCVRDSLDALSDGQVMLHIEADGKEAVWELTEDRENISVTWEQTETGSYLRREVSETVTDSLRLRFTKTQLQCTMRVWQGAEYLTIDLLADASREDEIAVTVFLSATTSTGESILSGVPGANERIDILWTRSDEGQRLSIRNDITIYYGGYGDPLYTAAIPVEIAVDLPYGADATPVTLYYYDDEGASHAVATMTFAGTYTDEMPTAPDFDALTLLHGLQDTRLQDEWQDVGVTYLTTLILTKLPKDAYPLMTTLLSLVAALSN